MSVLGIDWGKKKVGVATADSRGIAITPRGIFQRSKRVQSSGKVWTLDAEDKHHLQRYIETHEPELIVLGLPLNADGTESAASQGARLLAEEIAKNYQLEVVLVSEVLSSWAARDLQAGQKAGADDDDTAAAVILRDYFAQKESSRRGSVSQLFLSVAALLAFAGVLGLGTFYYRFAVRPAVNTQNRAGDASGSFVVDIPPQSSFMTLQQNLAQQGIVIDRLALRVWIRLRRAGQKLRIGECLVQRNWSAMRILDEILYGKRLLHKAIVPEGYNVYDIKQTLDDMQFFKEMESFFKLVHTPTLLDRMGVPRKTMPHGLMPSLEGFLFPETYALQKYDSLQKMLTMMLEQFEQRALPILKEHPWGATPEGRYKLLTLASIVEKESGVVSEQPVVASVFWNRINKKMRLESDPTIIYGILPNYDGTIHKKDIMTTTLYNTYRISGLPPTPICNPGEGAIRAVVHPATSDYLYFVATGAGAHVFSKDYKTHARNVEIYQLHKHAPATPVPPTPRVSQRTHK